MADPHSRTFKPRCQAFSVACGLASTPKFLLEIKHLDEPEDYIDPDLAFGAINQIKSWISRMAIVCPADVFEVVAPVAEIVRNYRKPVKKFSRVTDALCWLEQEK